LAVAIEPAKKALRMAADTNPVSVEEALSEAPLIQRLLHRDDEVMTAVEALNRAGLPDIANSVLVAATDLTPFEEEVKAFVERLRVS
jgi:hypothetical protein